MKNAKKSKSGLGRLIIAAFSKNKWAFNLLYTSIMAVCTGLVVLLITLNPFFALRWGLAVGVGIAGLIAIMDLVENSNG